MLDYLIDPLGRKIDYLRVSVTDRCDMRCVYCMSEDMVFLPRPDVLSFGEISRLCRTFIGLGTRRIRVTGGEPLVRAGIDDFLLELGSWLGRSGPEGGLDEVTLTTNGSQLVRFASSLRAAGIKRVNVSLDTLNSRRFRQITRLGRLEQTLSGIEAAISAGIGIRVNMVAMKHTNEDEIDSMIEWCGQVGADLCLIETMPMGNTGEDRRERYLPLATVRADLETRWTLVETDHTTGGPARYTTVAETGGRLGFITPLTHDFCGSCNRVRLSCTGTLYTCLGHEDGEDLRTPLRGGASDRVLQALIRKGIAHKPSGHNFLIHESGTTSGVDRHMSVTGG